jgi:parvulin-like peptidyl-prolyl isomerase
MRARTWAVVSGATAIIVALGIGLRAQAQGTPPKPAAVVNGQQISLAEVDAAVKVINGNVQVALQVPETRRRQQRFEALGILVDNLLLQQYLRKNAAPVDPKEMARHFAELETALKKENKKLADYLAENGMTEAQLRDQVINALQWREFTQGKVSDAMVEQYYKDNKDFFDGVQVRASHILIRIPLNGNDADVQAAQDKLKGIRQEIESGKITFEEAAQKYSQCPRGPEGGDVGYFPRKFAWDEEFAKAAFNPQLKIGDMIGLVRTEQGWHLIKLTDRKPGMASEFAKIKNDVRELYLTELRMSIVAAQRQAAKLQINLP